MRVRFATAVICLTLSALPAAAQPPKSSRPATATADLSAAALTLGRAVADWQLRHMDGQFDYVKTQHAKTQNPRGWIQGAFYAGLAAFAERTGERGYALALRAHGAQEGWGLGSRPLHADDHVIAQSWIWTYGRDPDPAQIAPVKARFDAILADPPKADLTFIDGAEDQPCQARWCWSDALFMAPPTWIALSAATSDPATPPMATGSSGPPPTGCWTSGKASISAIADTSTGRTTKVARSSGAAAMAGPMRASSTS